jgi:predicted dehydrogenase
MEIGFDMSNKTRVLLVGAAFSADLHMDGYARIPDKLEIAGICDKDKNRIEALAGRYGMKGFAVYDDFQTAIDQCGCDVVDICLPNFLHYPVAMAALKKGRHVICEKPLATVLEHGEEMVALAEKTGKKLYYAEDWLCAPAIRKALSLIGSGKLGKLLYVRCRECHNGSHSPFAQTIEYCGGGSMIHLGIHPVAFALALNNTKWKELTAMASGGKEQNLRHKSMEGEDWAAAMIRFEDGFTALVESNYVSEGGMEDVIDFYCTEGCLHLDLTFSSAIRAFSIKGLDYTVEKADITTGWSMPAVDEKHNLGYAAEINHFIECAAAGIDAQKGLRGIDGLEALRVVKLIYKSAADGIRISNGR